MPSMIHTALPLEGPALQLLRDAAQRHQRYIGGGFISIKGADRYNTYVLAGPDGTYGMHDKDIPTLWENCYYCGGHDDGIIHTDAATVGVALCWEFLRWQTARRLRGHIDVLIGGSSWWGYPQLPILRRLWARHEKAAVNIMRDSLSHMARILGIPVVHAAQAGSLIGQTPIFHLPYRSAYLGGTQIVDATGRVLARRSGPEGAGIITAEIELGAMAPPAPLAKGFGYPNFPGHCVFPGICSTGMADIFTKR